MHIPDGFINGPTALAATAASLGAVGYSLRDARERLDDRRIPMVGLTSAFVFATQMINFPVAIGTSGHLLGGALAAILLGPWMATLVLAVVLLVQALFFADGGITALGANITLMGLVAGIGGYALFRGLMGVLPKTRAAFLGATAVTSWTTVVVASVLCSLYLLLNGFPGAVFGAMVGVHALIGIGEALITTSVVAAVLTARPDLVYTAELLGVDAARTRRTRRNAGFVLAGMTAALFIGVVLSNVADPNPDGLESAVLETAAGGDEDELARLAGDGVYQAAPLPDYEITPLSGAIGVAVTFGLGAGAVALLRRRRPDVEGDGEGPSAPRAQGAGEQRRVS